jgi:hypothetical protein
MGRDKLSELLQGMPAERAHAAFAARVVAGLDARPSRTGRRLALGLLVAGALAATAVGALVWLGGEADARRRSALREEVASLRSEARALEQALGLPEADQAPLVYLGGDERSDYVLDLGQVEAPGGVLPVPLSNHGQGGVL